MKWIKVFRFIENLKEKNNSLFCCYPCTNNFGRSKASWNEISCFKIIGNKRDLKNCLESCELRKCDKYKMMIKEREKCNSDCSYHLLGTFISMLKWAYEKQGFNFNLESSIYQPIAIWVV